VPKLPERLAELVRAARRADSVQVAPPLPGGHLLVPPTRPAEVPASLPKLESEQKPPATKDAA
jgi:hypothetical protein